MILFFNSWKHFKLSSQALERTRKTGHRKQSQNVPFLADVLILGDPGAVSRVDKMFVVKVYCKIETSPWALTLTEPGARFSKLPVITGPVKLFCFPF